MLVKIKTESEKEITFPSTWVKRYYHLASDYYLMLSETNGLKVTEGENLIIIPKNVTFDTLEECTPEDIDMMKKWFVSNNAKFNEMFNPITVDLNSNTPSEVLEDLVKFESKADYSIDLKHNDKQDTI